MTDRPGRDALLTLLLLAAAAGCSSTAPDGTGTAASTASAATGGGSTPTVGTAVRTERSTTIEPGTATDGYVGARADVGEVDCRPDGDRWQASGTVTNPTEQRADYRIYVAFQGATRDAVGLVQVDVAGVGAHEHRAWTGGLAIAGTDLRCVLRVERVGPVAPSRSTTLATG